MAFTTDSTFTSTVGKKTLKGTYSYNASTKQVDLKELTVLSAVLLLLLPINAINFSNLSELNNNSSELELQFTLACRLIC